MYTPKVCNKSNEKITRSTHRILNISYRYRTPYSHLFAQPSDDRAMFHASVDSPDSVNDAAYGTDALADCMRCLH